MCASTSRGDLFWNERNYPAATSTLTPKYGNVLIGQTFSNLHGIPDGFPDTLDFQGPNGMVSIRNPQFRYGLALSPSTTFYRFRGKNPSSDITFKTSQFSSQPNAPSPDGAIRFAPGIPTGTFPRVAAIFRSIAGFSLPTTPTPKTDSGPLDGV